MKIIFYEVPSKLQIHCPLQVVKVEDILKILYKKPIKEEAVFQYVEKLSDRHTAIALFSSNYVEVEKAKAVVFAKITELLLEQETYTVDALRVLNVLENMEKYGVPIDEIRLLQCSEEYLSISKNSLKTILQKATTVGFHISEEIIKDVSFQFPSEYKDLNIMLSKVRKDIAHAVMLKPEKLKKYIFTDESGNSRLLSKWNYYGALSGRIQSFDFNLQGLPKRIREECLVPRPGYNLVLGDYVSEELVLIAILTEDQELLKEIKDGVDLHQKVAAFIFSKDISEVTKAERALAKSVVFAYLYGAGDVTLKKIISENWNDDSVAVNAVKEAIHSTFPKIKQIIQQIESQGYVRLIDDRTINLTDISKRHTAFNRMIQGSGAIVLKDVIATLSEQLPASGHICYLIHDEVAVEVADCDLNDCISIVTKVMKKILQKYQIDVEMLVSISIKKGGNMNDE